MAVQDISSRAKSMSEVLWGVGMAVFGVVAIALGVGQIPRIAGWLMLGFGVVCSLIGFYLSFSYSRLTFSPSTRTWKEVTGWLFFSRTNAGTLDDLSRIRVTELAGKAGAFFTIAILGQQGERQLELVFDVVHSEEEMKQIVATLKGALQVPVSHEQQ